MSNPSWFKDLFIDEAKAVLSCNSGGSGSGTIPTEPYVEYTMDVDGNIIGVALFGFIEIPRSVCAIGNYAFDSRVDIRGVNIPDTVTEIRGNAFSNCSGLYEVYLPRSIRYIEREAFKNCRGIKRIHVYRGTVCHKTAFKGLKLFAVKKYK
jgi:hypothetical protein